MNIQKAGQVISDFGTKEQRSRVTRPKKAPHNAIQFAVTASERFELEDALEALGIRRIDPKLTPVAIGEIPEGFVTLPVDHYHLVVIVRGESSLGKLKGIINFSRIGMRESSGREY